VLPGLDTAARRRFPVLQGLGAKNDTSLFVSRGVGTVYVPIRINCPPEVAILTLTGSRPLSQLDGLPRATAPTKPS
jgi:predicted MPP superfamily phosphohydrolase